MKDALMSFGLMRHVFAAFNKMSFSKIFGWIFGRKVQEGVKVFHNGQPVEFLLGDEQNLEMEIGHNLEHAKYLFENYAFASIKCTSTAYDVGESWISKANKLTIRLETKVWSIGPCTNLDTLKIKCVSLKMGFHVHVRDCPFLVDATFQDNVMASFDQIPSIWRVKWKTMFLSQNDMVTSRLQGVTHVAVSGNARFLNRTSLESLSSLKDLLVLPPFDEIEIKTSKYQKKYGVDYDTKFITFIMVLVFHVPRIKVPLYSAPDYLKDYVMNFVEVLGLEHVIQSVLYEDCLVSNMFWKEIKQNKAQTRLVELAKM
jgi:hypothetical protein